MTTKQKPRGESIDLLVHGDGEFHLADAISQGNIFAGACPTREVLKHVTGTWGVIVLAALTTAERHRFSELRRKVGGISEKMLTQTLQHLERDGFVLRTMHPVVPPHVDYELTDIGHKVAGHVTELADFLENNIIAICENQTAYDRKREATPAWNAAK